MRVIAGEAGGRILKAPGGRGTRPTTDRVKESLFSIIAAYLPKAAVLDLYAGTGALALEALSRGAASAVLVESEREATACIRRNCEIAGYAERCRVLRMPVAAALPLLAREGSPFDLIFMDPPYEKGLIVPTLQMLSQLVLVHPQSLIVAEHSRKEEIPGKMEKLAMCRRVLYGDTAISLISVL